MCLLHLFREMEGGQGTVDIAWTFLGGFLLGCSNTKKRGYHRNKKLFINKSAKALIKLKEGHQGLLKLHVPLRGCSTVGGKVGIQKGDFVWSRKTTCIVCIGIWTSPQKHHPLFFGKSPLPLNLQTIQAPAPPPFSGNSPIYIGSSWLHPIKIWFFSEPS